MVKKAFGCLVMLAIGFIVLVAIVGSMVGRSDKSPIDPSPVANRVQRKPTQMPVVTPSTQAAKSAVSVSISDSHLTPAPAAPNAKPEPSDELDARDARAASSKAAGDLEAARAAVITRVHASAAFKAAAEIAAKAEADVKASRQVDDGTLGEKSTAWMAAKNALSKIEGDAARTDPEVKRLSAGSFAANKRARDAETTVANRRQQEAIASAAKQKSDAAAQLDNIRQGAAAFGYIYATAYIGRLMNDPSSADVDYSSVGVNVETPGKSFTVGGIVRGKNLFGATVANQWRCTVTYTGGANEKYAGSGLRLLTP